MIYEKDITSLDQFGSLPISWVLHTCPECNERFYAQRRKVYCSQKCSDKAKRRLEPKDKVDKKTRKKERLQKLRVCPNCGKEFRDDHNKYCSKVCEEEDREFRLDQIQFEEEHGCEYCADLDCPRVFCKYEGLHEESEYFRKVLNNFLYKDGSKNGKA